jgi:hypothetical protein
MLKKLPVVTFFIFLSVAGVSGDTTELSTPQDAMVDGNQSQGFVACEALPETVTNDHKSVNLHSTV